MTPFRPLLFFLFACCLASGLVHGCSRQNDEQGVVARVNGEPITLAQLEAKHDLKYLAGTINYTSSLEGLQTEFGLALSEMIVNKLIAQYLAARELGISEQELDAVELQIRTDYSEDAFDQMLVEEYIDLGLWREQLKNTLNQEKLLQKVLRPRISIDYQEIDSYYRENIVDFYLPPRVRFLYILGAEMESVEKVLEMSRRIDDPIELGSRFDRVDVHEYTLQEDNMPTGWRSLLDGLNPGQSTGVMHHDGQGFQAMALRERTPGRIVEIAQAYSMVERILLERKLQEAFEDWLAEEFATARIEVNTHLLHSGHADAAEGETDD